MKLSAALQKLVDRAERAMNSARKKTKPKSRAAIKRRYKASAAEVERQLLDIRKRRAARAEEKRTTKKRKATKKRTTKKRPIAKRGKKPARAGFPAKTKRRTAATSSRKRKPAKRTTKRRDLRLRDAHGPLRWENLVGGIRRMGMFVSNPHGDTVGKAIIDWSPQRGYEWTVETEAGAVKASGWNYEPDKSKREARAALAQHFRRYLR